MITVTKQENGVLFAFQDSDKYLYGSGTIEVPFNSLSIIQDESDNITLRKSASNDIFLSARYDTDFGYASKEEAVNALKEILYDEAGISEEEVQQMIDAATSGIPSSQVVEQLRTDVNAVSGEVDTLQDDVAGINNILTAHTANTNIHVTSTDKSNWDAKQDRLTAGENITISGNVISAEAGNNIIELTQAEYDALTEKDPDALYIITDAQEINMNNYATKSEVDASIATKADVSALTAVNNSLTAHTANTEVHVTQAEKNTWNGKLDASAYTPTDLSQYWTSGQTQEAINAATSGIPSSQVVEQLRTDVNTISGATESLNDRIDGVWTEIDAKEEVIASALTQLNQDVADIDAKEEVIASALTEVRQDVDTKQDVLSAGTGIEISGNVISATGGALFVNFDDLMNNMNDDKWDELVDALQNNKPIFAIYNNSGGDTTDIEQMPVDGYIYIGGEYANIELRQLYNGGWYEVSIVKNGSEDYEVTDGDGYDYQPTLQAGSGISIDDNNVISVTGASITVDSELDETSNNPVANSAITTAIIDNEEVISRAINDLNDRIGDPYQKVSGLTIQYNSDNQSPEVIMEVEDEELGAVNNLFNKYGVDLFSEDVETGHQNDAYISNDGSMGVFDHSEGQEGDEDEGMTYDKNIDLYPDRLEINDTTNGENYNKSDTVTISKDVITMNKTVNDNGDETSSSIEINNNQDDGVFVNLNDGTNILDLNTNNFDWTNGSDVRQVNWSDIAGLDDIDAATSGKADTSAVTAAIDSAKAYYIDFGALTTQGIHDADWDGMVNAINAHRPIYAGLGGEYYVSECLAQTGNQIILTASNHLAHFFYTFTKNGSENYSFSSETRPYTTTQEKTAWSAKQDALTAGSGISISNNVISTSGVVMSQTVTQLVKLTQAAYDALSTKDSDTLYIISD